MSNPFEKYFQATERQNDKINRMTPNWEVPASSPFVPFDTSLDARYSELNKPYTPDPTLKSAGDLLVDAAASALKIPTIIGGVAVGAADLALSAASKPFEWAMDAGHAVRPDLIPEPMDVGIGYIAKGLHDTIGYRPEEAKAFIDEKLFSDARKIQEKEYHSGYTAAEDKAFQDSWTKDYQTQYLNLQQAGATEQQLKDFSAGFDKQYQDAATKRADKYQTSWDKPLSENINIIGHGFNNLLENPSLAVGGAIESAGYLLPSMAVSRGVMALEKAAKVAALGEGAVGAIKPLSPFLAAGIGEGSVSGLVTLEQMRSQIPDGIAGGKELLGALGVAASTGLIGAGFGKAASKLGIDDVDSVGLGRAASQVAAMKLPALTRPVGAIAQEGAEEFLQTFGESIIPNVTMGKDPLEGLGQELPMGTMAGAIMGAGMNAPSLVTGGFSDISSGLGKVKDATSLKSFDTLSNPEHKNYNPAQAFNIQLKNLESNDETVRTQAEASVSKLETDLNTARASVEKRIKSIQATLKAMPPSDQTTDAQKLEIEALSKEYTDLKTKSDKLTEHFIGFIDAQVTAQEHRDVKQGTQFTEEQAKADIATLTQPIPSQTVWSNQDTDIPVEVIGEPEVDEQGNEFTKVRYTPQEGADPIESYVPTSELVPTQGNNDVAQQEALNRVTRHFSKYSNDDLDLLASSPVLTESQRNSLRVLSKSKRELAAVQDPSQVFDNILNGYKGKTIQESHRGLNQYTDMVNTAVATKNPQLATLALDGLGAFTDDHTAKKDAINEAFGLVQNGTYAEVQTVRTQDGTWGMVPFTAQEVKAGKNAAGAEYLSKEALNKVGGFNVHINSDKNGAITQINNETQLIQDRFDALSGVAESFVGVTPKPVDTSIAPTVGTPVVTESSQRSPKLEEAYKETFSKPIENWDANDFASVGAQATHIGSTFDSKTIDADNAFSQKMAKKIIADGIAKNRSTADIMQDVMFVAYSPDFAMSQSGVSALRAYIELRKAQGTSTTPIVTKPSDTTAPVVTPAPEAPVQSGAMTPEVNQSLEDYIKSLGRTSTDKYKQDLLTTFNAEVDKSISNGYVGGLVGSTKEYNKDKHAVLVAIAASKGYTVGTPIVGNAVYTATLTKSTATPATPVTPTETPVEDVPTSKDEATKALGRLKTTFAITNTPTVDEVTPEQIAHWKYNSDMGGRRTQSGIDAINADIAKVESYLATKVTKTPPPSNVPPVVTPDTPTGDGNNVPTPVSKRVKGHRAHIEVDGKHTYELTDSDVTYHYVWDTDNNELSVYSIRLTRDKETNKVIDHTLAVVDPITGSTLAQLSGGNKDILITPELVLSAAIFGGVTVQGYAQNPGKLTQEQRDKVNTDLTSKAIKKRIATEEKSIATLAEMGITTGPQIDKINARIKELKALLNSVPLTPASTPKQTTPVVETKAVKKSTHNIELDSTVNKGVKGYVPIKIPNVLGEYGIYYAKPVTIEGSGDFKFYVHQYTDGSYSIVEFATGVSVTDSRAEGSIKSAVAQLTKYIADNGLKSFEAIYSKYAVINSLELSKDTTTAPEPVKQAPKIGETSTEVKGRFTTTKTVVSDNTVLSVHTNNDTGEVTKSEYVTTYPDIYSDELGDKYTIVIYRDSANPSVITDVKSFDAKDKKNSLGSYGKAGTQTDEQYVTTFTEDGDVTLEYTDKFEKPLPVIKPKTPTTAPVEAEPSIPETVEGLVKEHGYLGELLADEDVPKVVKDVIETVLEVKAGEKRLISYSRFVGLFAVHGYIEYFTKQAKNDPNIIKLTKAANKLRNLVRLTQHINFLEDYVDSQNNDDLRAYLNKYPELKSIFSELKVKNPTKGTRSLALDVIADFTQVKNLLTTELGKLVQLVGLMYIQAAFEKGQQYLRDTNYADLNEVLSPTVLTLLKGEGIGILAKNKVFGDDAAVRRNSITDVELTFLDKIDGIPVGELSKEDFETVKALVQNAVNAGFNSYKVVNYTRNEEKISSDIVHNIIVEHLPKEGFALENFTPEEVIKGAVPESFIWDFEKKAPETTEDTGKDNKADLILPIGTSGSGKSTWIKSVNSEGDYTVISLDDLRVELTGDVDNKTSDEAVYAEAIKRAVDAVKVGKQVIFDTTNLKKDRRAAIIDAIRKAKPNANIQYKLLPLDPALAKQRIKDALASGEARANVDDATIDRHAKAYVQALEDIKQEGITAFPEILASLKPKAEPKVKTADTTTPVSEEAEAIYENLESKTETGNVQLKPVYQGAGITYAKSVGGIFSLRVNNSKHHFGNPFSSVAKLLAADSSLIPTKNTQESVERYIDWVLNSKDERAKWIRSVLQSGDLKGKPIIYYAELGEPSHANALDYLINTHVWESQSATPEEGETSTESHVEPVATEDAKVTALQGVTDAVREEERNKPFSIRNMIRAYFTQDTTEDEQKGNNPLVLIKDFILQSDLLTNVSKYLSEKTKSRVTDAHIAQLKDFQEFHAKFSKVVMRVLHDDRSKVSKDNFVRELLNQENPEDLGTLDENVLTAISLAAYGYLIRFGNTVYNTDDVIRSIVRLKKDQELPSEVAQILRYAGHEAPIVEQQLGEQISKSLALKAMKDSSATLQNRLDVSFGNLVTAALHDVGYIELDDTSISPKVVGELLRHAGYAGNEDSGTQEESDGLVAQHALEKLSKLTFIRPNYYKDPKGQGLKLQTPDMIERKSKNTYSLLAPERDPATGDFYIKKLVWGTDLKQTSSTDIMNIIGLAKPTAGFLSKLMGVDVGFTVPTTTEPESIEGNTKQGTNNTVPKQQQELVKEGQVKAKFSIRANTVNALNALKSLSEDSKLLKQLLGVWYDDDVKARTHIRDRDSVEAKNKSEWDILERGLDWAGQISLGNDEYLDFYDTQYVSQNERMQYLSNFFNMQSSQLHRAMASLSAFKLDISLEDLTLSNENLTRFYQAVGEGLEGLDDVLQASIKKRAGLQQFFTVDKVSADNYVEALQEYLKSDESVKAIDAMVSVLRGNKPSEAEQASIAQFVEHGDMGIQSLQSLIALAEMQIAVLDGKSSFTTTVGLGSDGVNNGVASANILTGVISRDMKQQVGMLAKGQVKTMQEAFLRGLPDYYISFGIAMGKALKAVRERKSTTVNNTKWHDALQELFPVYKAIEIASLEMRKVAKTWSIPFNYGAGKKSLQRALGRGFLDGIYKEMTSISNKALEAKANLKSGKITEEAYTLIQEDLKLKANTLELRINTILQRARIKKDSKGEVISINGKNQYLPRYSIKFPTDLTHLNEYTFGNALEQNGYDYFSMNRDTAQLVEQLLLDAVNAIHGTAAWEATQEYAEKYTKIRDVLNTSNTAAFMLYNGMRTKLIQAKLKQKEDALLGTIRAWNEQVNEHNEEIRSRLGALKALKSPEWRNDTISTTELKAEHKYLGLTTEEMREIDDILAPINPTLHSALSQETGDLKSGIALATQETAIQKAEPSKQVETKYLNKYIRTEKGFASMRPVLRGLKDKLEVTSGIKSLAMAIQGIDAYVAAYLQAKFPTLNVHDAGIFGLKYFREATKYQNEIYLQAMTTYHLNVEHAEALVRSYLGLKDFIASLDSLNLSPEAKELFIKEAGYAMDDVLNGVAERNADGTVKTKKVMENMFNEETGEMEQREITIEIRTGIYKGLTEALGKLLGYEFDELTDIDSALKLWVSLAISKDLDKLESLKDIKSVHQYSGEGGEFTIGAKGDLEFSEHMRRIEEQRIALLVRKKELTERIDRAGTELNLETGSSTRQSQLSKLFVANKGKGIDALAVVAILKSDKSASRSSEQHQRQLQILRAIEPFLKGVKVIYKDMENNEAEGITDRVRGFYEPKTNTIVIRANVIKSDDLALIVHEMLHAALSSRIEAIKSSNNKDSAEYKALAQLEDLRTQLLDNEVLPVNGNEFLALKAKVEKSGGAKAYDNAKEAIKNNREYQQAVANKQSIKASLEQANTDLAELNTKFTETQNKLESSKDNSLTLNRVSSERSNLKDELRAEQAALQESLVSIAKEQITLRQQVKALHTSIKQANKEIEALIGKDKQIMQDVRTYHEMRNTLKDTVFVVQGGGKLSALKLVEMLEDVHEFISYGLTETTLQDIMQDVFEVPKGNRKPLSLRGAWKMFISAVGRILRMPNTKTLNALTAFSMDVADLLNAIGTVTPAEVSPDANKQYSLSAEDLVNGQSSLDIMQALPHSNTGAFNQQLDRLIVGEIGQLYNQDDAAKARIDEIQTFTASDALNAGFTLSRKEQYVQQALQYAVAAYMKLHAGGANVGQLRRVYHAAKAKMDATGKDFHEGDWATATQQEKDIAKAKYDFMFDSTKEDYMSRFVSMALASESVNKLLDIALPLTKPDTQDKTWFEKVNDWVSYVMAWLTNKYVRLNPVAGASNKLVQLMNNLVKLDIRNRQEGVALHQKAWNTIGLVTTPLNKALKGAGGALLSGVGLRNSRFLPVRALGAILVLRSEEAAKAIPKMIIDMRNNQLPNTKLGEVANILLEASGVGTLRDKFDVLIRQTNLNAKNRQDIVDNVKKAVNKWFKTPLTKAQNKAIAYGLLGTDAQALLENYSVEDIVKMALHEGKLNAEIAKLKKEIAKNPNGNDMLNAAEQLGYYMVTRIGGEGLVKNALGIAIGLGTQYFTPVEQADPKLVGQLNTLVSMLAMTHVPNSDKAILAALYKTDAEGIHATIQLHQGLVNDSLKDFQANPLNMVKGWMPEVTNPYLEIKAANSMVEREQMEAEGWVLIDELKRDKHDKGSPKYLMKHNDIGYQRLVSGAVDLGSTARSGTEAINRTDTRYLGITQARYQNAARRAAIPNGSFDPSKQPRGLIAAYDTDGAPLGYNYEMDNETRDAHLDRKHNIGDLLGTFGGLNYYKPEKTKQSNTVAEVLFEDYKANYSQNPNAYLKISHKSTDPKVVEMWRMLPQDFRQRATELYGKGNPIIIRNEAFNLAFGFKKFSVVSYAFDAVNAERERIKKGLDATGKSPNKFQSAFVGFAEATSNFKSGVIGAVGGTRRSTPQADFAKAEHVTQEIVKAIKDFIVIRSGTTMMWNIFANVLMLMANGINPVTIIKDWVFAVTNVRAYQKLNSQLIQAQADLAGGKDPVALKQRIGALKAELKANVMNPYINAGLLSSIVEDVNIQQGEYTYASAFKQTVDEKTRWIPKPVKTAAAVLTIAPSTKLYQFLATTTQLSDFVAKYSMSKHLQANGTDINASIIEASKTFINYDVPTSQGLQYANDMGLFMFTKFFLRIQAVLMKLLGKRAGSTIAQHLLVENLTGAEGILSPIAYGHIGNNPIESSVFGLPSAFFSIGTVDAVTDFGVPF